MTHIKKAIDNTEALISLISKSAATISDKEIRNKTERWIINYSNNFLEILDSYPKAITALNYLKKSISNVRLKRELWLKNLRIIYKALKAQMIDADKKTILIFDPNKPFTAYRILQSFFIKAKKEILIFDGYVEDGTLHILSKISKKISVKIITNNTYRNFVRELSLFKKEHSAIEVRQFNIHDRFFITDNSCYILGNSLHAVGKTKPTYFLKTSRTIGDIFKNHFNNIWTKSKKII